MAKIEKRTLPALTEEEEIIEKKPTAPMAIALLMITFVVLVFGTYLNWSTLSERYFDVKMYDKEMDAQKTYENWHKKQGKHPADNVSADLGGRSNE